jgi:hypothetical protein
VARLQILQLPEGAGDDRPPFVLVVDQYQPLRCVEVTADGHPQIGAIDEFAGVAEKVGALAVVTFRETVEIPGNDVLLVADDAADSRRRCGEHDGPCFPEAGAKCVAHGDEECLYCHRNPADCANGGNCGRWIRTGMHWDTCANRVRGPLASETSDSRQTAQIIDAHERTRLALCRALLLPIEATWHQVVEAAGERRRSHERLCREFDKVTADPTQIRVYLGDKEIDVQEISRRIASDMKQALRDRG